MNHDVVTVFVAWQTSTGKARTRLSDERRRKIERALKYYPLDEVLDAVDGWRFSPFHRGDNAEGRVWNELTLLLRNDEKIEFFRDAKRDGLPTAAPQQVEPAGWDAIRQVAEARREQGRLLG